MSDQNEKHSREHDDNGSSCNRGKHNKTDLETSLPPSTISPSPGSSPGESVGGLSEPIDAYHNKGAYNNKGSTPYINISSYSVSGDRVPVPFCLTSEGRILYSNKAMAELLSTTQEALKGQDFLSIIHPWDIASFIQFYKEVSEKPPSPMSFRTALMTFSNQRVEVEATLFPFILEEQLTGLILIENTGERDALKCKLDDLQDILNFMHHAVLLLDREDRILYATKKVDEVIGHPSEELAGKEVISLFPEVYRPQIADSLKKAHQGVFSRLEQVVLASLGYGYGNNPAVSPTSDADSRNAGSLTAGREKETVGSYPVYCINIFPVRAGRSGSEKALMLIEKEAFEGTAENAIRRRNLELWLKSLILSCPVPAAVVNSRLDVVVANEEAISLLGLSLFLPGIPARDTDAGQKNAALSEDASPMNLADVITEDSRRRLEECITNTLRNPEPSGRTGLHDAVVLGIETKKPMKIEMRIKPVEILPVPLLFATFAPCVSGEKAEEGLTSAGEWRNKADNRLIYEFVEEGVDFFFASAADFTILDISQGFCDAVGLSREVLIGKNLLEFIVLVNHTSEGLRGYLESHGKLYD